MNERKLTTYYILDLDRTILDTNKSTELMKGVLALHNAHVSALLSQEFENYTMSGESFSMRDFIAENVDEAEMHNIEVKYKVAASSQDLLMPGAKDLMDYIRSLPDTSLGIMTYGSELGQQMKIDAAGLGDVPSFITAETYKGAVIATWRQEDDLYHMPKQLGGFMTKKIIFVDDKPFSFTGLPIDCRGYLVKSLYDAGIEKLPSNVVQVTNLAEVLLAEKQPA